MTVAVAFIDFRKAFGSVSHDVLLFKVQNEFGIPGSFLNWLTSYLKLETRANTGLFILAGTAESPCP